MSPNFNLSWAQWVSVVALGALAIGQFAQDNIGGGIASVSAALAIFGIGTAISQVHQSVTQVAQSNLELKQQVSQSNLELKKQLQVMQKHK